MSKLKKQLWVSSVKTVLDEAFIQPVSNGGNIGVKGGGGLWTSSYIEKENSSEWIEWCLNNEYGLPSGDVWHGFILEPKDDLNLYTIDNLVDMHTLFDRYGYSYIPNTSMEAIDFEKMSKDYDGLRMTSEGQMRTRFGFGFYHDSTQPLKKEWKEKAMRSFYGWDCESTFHFKWNFKTVSPIEIKVDKD